MHHMLFPQNPQTATFCSYKDDNESAARWMSERESHFPSPCSPGQQVVSSLCLVCLLALSVALPLTRRARQMKPGHMHTSTHNRTSTPASCLHREHHFHRTQLLPEELRDSGSCFSSAAAVQLNFRNRRMNKQKINGASWCEDAGLFSQLRQTLLLGGGAYQPFAEPPDIQHKAFDVTRSWLGFDSILLNLRMALNTLL